MLVRAFSLLCVLVAAWALNRTATYLWGPRAGLITAAVFLFTGPIMFMGGLATFDAPVVAMICLALWLGITRPSAWSAILTGGILALETATKYAGGIFVPVVIAAMIVVGDRGWQRAIAGTFTTGGILGLVWLRWGNAIREDLAFTTTAREALSPASTNTLIGYVWSHLGVLMVISLVGLIIAFRGEGVRHGILCIGFLGAAAMLPVAQMRLGEAVSFEKHLGYSAIFLSLIVGLATSRISQLPLMVTPTMLLMVILVTIGWARSDHMYQWVNVAPVIKAIEMDPKSGIYISSATDSLKYHTHGHDNIRWETTFNLYVEGEEEIRRTILSERYQAIILRTASTGNPEQDRGQEVLLDALRNSPSYDLAFEPFPVTRTANDHWLYYTHIPRTAPIAQPTSDNGSGLAEHERGG